MLKCLMGHAAIDPATVWHDGLDYRANCPRCDAPMIQDLYLWRLFCAADYDVLRHPRPADRRPARATAPRDHVEHERYAHHTARRR